MSAAALLATKFSAIVRRDLKDRLAEIRRRNKRFDAEGNDSCATHDFCDANMLMDEAFTEAFGREIDLQSDADLSVWNAAWGMARASGFRGEQ
jgi:hypothetical protein